ncbi:helix-turn-helix transcriptional regulator [Paenibacillus thiaminolyticus]|uniref:helix-turn-helix transcriptional regulator n=1 Tax=Paenibacillus thiaminolyticus TaxID=49283 RepID=UPI003D2BBA95
MPNRPRTIRWKFKELRKKAGSQRVVAKKLGTAEVTIRHIENGHFTPSASLMAKCAVFLGSTVEELFPDIFDGL